MDGASVILYGFLGCGGIAGIIWYISSIFNKKSDILSAVHEITQKINTDKIKDINANQNRVKVTVEDKEKLTTDSIEKIKTIQKKASNDIQQILKENRIDVINKEIDDDWENI